MSDRAVAIIRAPGAVPTRLLDTALKQIGFEARVRTAIGESKAFRVIIVPALDAFAAGSPAATNPRLVEHLIDQLFDLGASKVDIGSTLDSSALWLENRDPFMLADLLGYRYETPQGRPYDVLDFADGLVDDAFPAASALGGSALSREWLEADFRIVFASSRTDPDDGYALCLSTLTSVLPLRDKHDHYRLRRDPGAVVAALLDRAPVNLALIDAVESAHGSGCGTPLSLRTDTIIAATEPALADHFGALLMSLDPFISETAAASLRRPELLDDVRLIGALDPYPGWVNVDPLLIHATKRRRQSPVIDRTIRPLLHHVDRDLFPFSNPTNDRANAAITALLDGSENSKLLTGINLWLGQFSIAHQAWATHFGKDTLHRIKAPINVDPNSISGDAFAAIVSELRPLTALFGGVPADTTGLRWRAHDGAILFDGVRRYPIPFDAFTAAVDIARSIEYMNDYIGGSSLVVACDNKQRTMRQIERNLYLPQPNYTILFGGKVIDVTKIEAVDHGPRRHQMAWKTIKSENDSAVADDGIVTFEALGSDTLVTIFGRQRFRLPPLLEAVNLDLWPKLKQALVSDAYQRFFRRTFANLEAVAEGRDPCIGRDGTDVDEPLPIDQLMAFITSLSESGDLDVLGLIKQFGSRAGTMHKPICIDTDGFHHFTSAPRPSQPVAMPFMTEVYADLKQAALVDAGGAR